MTSIVFCYALRLNTQTQYFDVHGKVTNILLNNALHNELFL
jgi:hypothetical protein